MNIFLIPYTPMRHLSVAFLSAAAALLAWWFVLAVTLLGSPWPVDWDGPVFLGLVSASAAGATTLAEGTLTRTPVFTRLLKTFGSFFIAATLAIGWYWGWYKIFAPILFSGSAEDLADPSLVSLKYRLVAWVFTGIGASAGPLMMRRFRGFVSHVLAGIAAGLVGAAVWHGMGYPTYFFSDDLYLASACGALAFGFTFGGFAWAIPDSLYAGWLRIVTETRHGRRIPIDALDAAPRERFVGHFPRGLDVFLPSEDGVLEMHLSVMVNRKQEYRARGLTLQPTAVRRFLERVDLSYDPRRSAPLETRLRSGDRILLGPPGNQTVVEFIMLPREEK